MVYDTSPELQEMAATAAQPWNSLGKLSISPSSSGNTSSPTLRISVVSDSAAAWDGKYVAPQSGEMAQIYINVAHTDGSPTWATRVLSHELSHALGLGDTYDDPSRLTHGDPRRTASSPSNADIADYNQLDQNGTRCGSNLPSVQYTPAAPFYAAAIAGVVALLVSIYGLYYLQTYPQFTGQEVAARIPGGASLGVDWITEKAMIALAAIAGDADPPRPEWKGEGNHAEDLPTEGDMPYEPPKQGRGKPVRIPERGKTGYVDEKGRYWEWDTSGHGGPHWDVQLNGPKPGPHKNVYPNGHIRD
ncbi:hypothetical protein [Tsukamurella tyrosinosolvens]|uniref:hypothetical protein n=1 Tax=Tsukamurella tyrosinosolvens TaxID=57704 RepID=UPI002DD41D07|nr:hypothetical protein [Tsukamurella tyrosinosolvens]MEC4611560.1 hypothetical protein [Tsukamurella tyrosinosolvens]